MIKINGISIAEQETEYVVELIDGVQLPCYDENDAKAMQVMFGGKPRHRRIYIGDWEDTAVEGV
jgi:hypothetical protein